MKQQMYISDLHFENQIWMNELGFFKDELQIFESRLGELVVKYTDKEFLARLEHFQNQFIRQKEVHDELMHRIKKHEAALSQFAAEQPTAINHVKFRDHPGLRDSMKQFRKIYSELKEEFIEFMAAFM